MSPNLADRLNTARHARFTGRSEELGLFESALYADSFPFFVLHIFGPGGVGKTTLLHEYARLSEQRNARPVYLDARDIDPTPEVFTRVLDATLGAETNTPIPDLFVDGGQRSVILIDTYETLTPLDGWLRAHFLPQLPETVLTVFAGRNPPADAWQTDPGWQSLIRTIALRNLSSDESRAFLAKRGIPANQHGDVIGFTHGHPLALSLVAEVFSQRGQVGFHPEESPDVVKTLMNRFIQQVPGPAHRAALEACAQVRAMTEALLSKMLALPDDGSASESVHELFEWLRRLSFIETNAEGIFPHDLARETLVADLRWRNPDWYVELHHRARKYYTARLSQTSGLAQQRLMLDTVFLHRKNTVIRSFFDWQTTGGIVPYAMQSGDLPALEQMVKTHEGPESASLAARWMKQVPEAVTVWRDGEHQPIGFVMALPLHTLDDEQARLDPAVQSTRNYLAQHAPLQPAEAATLFRFWMSAEAYQGVSPIQSLIFINVAKHYLTTPGLAFTFFPCADADLWSGILGYAELARLPEADFQVGERYFGVYGHDWRVMTPAAWIARLAEKEVGAANTSVPSSPEPLIVLSRSNFEEALRQALQGYARAGGLTGNPLLQSRLVAGETGSGEKREALKSRIKSAAEALCSNPRDEKLFRALDKTYFHPAPTQEAASELLDIPFSTYRRHLTTGIQRISEVLWQQETGESEQKMSSF